ncbi:MAG: GyrI-like domain-containing protein [Proteobacteria bacterium]|nr:GyrI-like domain-containing protein [Pseudomonadota bacterium]
MSGPFHELDEDVIPPTEKEQTVELKEASPLLVASARGFGSREDVTRIMMDLFRWVLTKGGQVSSYPLALFPTIPENSTRPNGPFEVCVPVRERILEEEDLVIRHLPGIKVACSRHRGSLSGINEAYGRIREWILENGLTPLGRSREIYLTSPFENKEEDMVTEIQIPVKRLPGNTH